MIQKNHSLYFDNVEMFIKMHPDKAPLAMLRSAVKSNGCPEELVYQIINSAIAHDVNLKVTPEENLMSLSKEGVVYDTFNAYNPTYDELIADVSARFVDLGEERTKAIVDFLITKGALTVYPDGKLYRTKVLLPRLPLAL
ncbi:MAG: hypothetical protein IJ145_07440 [Prevotella sp.]|nr:hypothetical protein [Prevotella sp.]